MCRCGATFETKYTGKNPVCSSCRAPAGRSEGRKPAVTNSSTRKGDAAGAPPATAPRATAKRPAPHAQLHTRSEKKPRRSAIQSTQARANTVADTQAPAFNDVNDLIADATASAAGNVQPQLPANCNLRLLADLAKMTEKALRVEGERDRALSARDQARATVQTKTKELAAVEKTSLQHKEEAERLITQLEEVSARPAAAGTVVDIGLSAGMASELADLQNALAAERHAVTVAKTATDKAKHLVATKSGVIVSNEYAYKAKLKEISEEAEANLASEQERTAAAVRERDEARASLAAVRHEVQTGVNVGGEQIVVPGKADALFEQVEQLFRRELPGLALAIVEQFLATRPVGGELRKAEQMREVILSSLRKESIQDSVLADFMKWTREAERGEVVATDSRERPVVLLPVEQQLKAMRFRAQRAELAVRIALDGEQPSLPHRITQAHGAATAVHEYKIAGTWTALSASEVQGRGYKRSGEALAVKTLLNRATGGPGGAAKRKAKRAANARQQAEAGVKLAAVQRRETCVEAEEARQKQRRTGNGESSLQALHAAIPTMTDPIAKREVKAAARALEAGLDGLLGAVGKPGNMGSNVHNAIGQVIKPLRGATKDARRANAANAKATSKPSRSEQAQTLESKQKKTPPFRSKKPGYAYGKGRQAGGDIDLNCRECSKTFVWPSSEQAYYASKNWTSQPGCCKPCREARRNKTWSRHEDSGSGGSGGGGGGGNGGDKATPGQSRPPGIATTSHSG